MADSERIATARRQVLDRLVTIEVALNDLRDPTFAFPRLSFSQNPQFEGRLRLRIMAVVLNLRHLEDDVRRLSRHLGARPEGASNCVAACQALRVLRRLADSDKHGLGGRRAEGAVLNGMLAVHKREAAGEPTGPEAKVHVVGMIVADATEGTFPSSALFSAGVRAWAETLSTYMPEAGPWLERCVPRPRGSVVELSNERHTVVPLGATVVVELPAAMREALQHETARRVRKA